MLYLPDYVAWRGDLSMEERPFQLLDTLVLAQMSYCSFPPPGEPITIREWITSQGENLEVKGLTDEASSLRFARSCAATHRFGDLVIEHWQDTFDPEEDLQFAAFTIALPDQTYFVAYRGTDQSIAGWKEDFMISFTRPRSQDLALTYLQETIRLHPSTSVRVAGHSKGGNLALYACAYLDMQALDHLEHAYILDGPGFCPEVLDLKRIQALDPFCTRVVPGYSVIGHLFSPEITDTLIVRSTENTIMQHDMMSWCVTAEGLDTLTEPDPAATFLNEALDSWIRSVPIEDRKQLVENLFDPMMQDGTTTLDAFASKGITAFEEVALNVIGLRSSSLKTAMALPEHALFGDVPDQIRASKPLQDRKRRMLLIDLGIIILGLACHLIPEHFMDLLTTIALVVFAGIQLIATVHKLYKTHWNLRQNQPLLGLTMTLIGISMIIFTKENALFMLSSVLFGIGFLLNAAFRAAEIKEARRWWVRLGHIAEVAVSAILGGFILVAPAHTVLWYVESCGSFLIIDGIFRLLSHRLTKDT